MAADPVPTHVHGFTNLGLIEMTRERRGPSLADLTTERELRPTARTMALSALRRAVAEAAHRPGKALAVVAVPEVVAALRDLAEARAEAEARIGRPLSLRADPCRAREDVVIEDQS